MGSFNLLKEKYKCPPTAKKSILTQAVLNSNLHSQNRTVLQPPGQTHTPSATKSKDNSGIRTALTPARASILARLASQLTLTSTAPLSLTAPAPLTKTAEISAQLPSTHS